MVYSTFIVNPIRPDYIEKCLESLYKYTTGNFRVVVVDQTMDGIYDKVKDTAHMYLRPHRNLGFAKSMNEGIIHSLRWGSDYTICMNDDVEFINHSWWDGILATFDMDPKILACNPMSIREPGWGYGLPHGEYIDLLPYKEEYTQAEYDLLLKGDFTSLQGELDTLFTKHGRPNTYPKQRSGVIDAIATWCTIFKKEFFDKVGMFEERYYPGGGEDYDLDARVYSNGYRMVGTPKCWMWHWWGSSKDNEGTSKAVSLPIEDKYRWANPDELWLKDRNGGKGMDPWGHWTDEKGIRQPMYRVPQIGVIDI